MSRLVAAAGALVTICSAAYGEVITEIDMRRCAAVHSFDRDSRRPAESDCNQRRRVQGNSAQVINGEVAPDERHTAAIFYIGTDRKRRVCTGILLDDRHLLTAGHCACGIPTTYEVSFDQEPMQKKDPQVIKLDGAPILFDPATCVFGTRPGMDLALLKLAVSVRGLNKVSFGYPAFTLASQMRDVLAPGNRLQVVGYGETEAGSIAVRMKATIPVLSTDCWTRPHRFVCSPFQEMILAEQAGAQRPRDTCSGDSGGPVFARTKVRLRNCDTQDEVTQEQNVLVAVTSRAAPFTHAIAGKHCAGGGIYTLIGRRSVHRWLDAHMVKPQECINAAE